MGVFTREASLAPAPNAELSPLNTPRTLVAASQRIRVDDRQAMERLRTSAEDTTWQTRAWGAYNSTGEIHYGFNLVASLISRIRFYPAAEVAQNAAPSYVKDSADLTPGLADAAILASHRLAASTDDMGLIVRQMALNLSVPGECYLVQMPSQTTFTAEGVTTTHERWEVRSTDEVVVSTDSRAPVRIRNRADTTLADHITLPQRNFIARIWRRHPRWSAQADSSMRAILDLVDELMVLNQTFKATARSRLNSGLLFVPDGLSASSPSADAAAAAAAASPDGVPPGDDDEFEIALLDGMMTPIQDPSDASAVVPILVRGPAELGDKIRYITFERVFDPSLVQRADRVLERILQGIDLPKDVVSGLANVRYSNAIQIEESLFKAHVEPLVLLICDALTDVYLRPSLQAYGYTPQQAERIRFWYDPSEVVSRPNRNADAMTAYDRYALSSRALREALGFNEDDAPTPTEIVARLLFQKGPMSPELAEAILQQLAPEFMKATRATAQATSENPLPPEVNDILNGFPSPPGAPTPEEPAPPPSPQGPRAATPSTNPPADEIPGLPPLLT